jgi:hypothetical protein
LEVRVRRVGGLLMVNGAEPAMVATILGQMPGVGWIAAGVSANSYAELGAAAKSLAGKYLRRGDRFAVLAEATGSAVVSDVAGVVTSAALGEVEGIRIDEESPRTTFRTTFDGRRGAVGVQIIEGPGGVPTSSAEAVCLVSGGKHSSVVAWMALLSGYRVNLVHASVGDESLREVAKLYAEFSHRVDCTKLSLEVLGGGVGALAHASAASEGRAPVFGGFHAGCSEIPAALAGAAEAPLFLLPEAEFDASFESLGLKANARRQAWTDRPSAEVSRRSFGGVRADANGVLDGLTRQPLRPS